VAEGVGERAAAVAVELVLHGTHDLRARGHRLGDALVDVGDVDREADRGAAARLRADRVHLGVLVGEHDRRVADADLRVADAAVGPGEAHELLGAERLLVEVDDVQVRRDGVVSVGDGLHGHGVAPSR